MSQNPNAKCLYHQNNGHWTDRCWPLRHAIQDLIDKGKVIVQDTQGTTPAANIMQNPLPTHAPQSATPSNPVNTLDEAGPRFDPSVLIRNVQQMKGITQECKDFYMTHCVSIHPSTPPPHSSLLQHTTQWETRTSAIRHRCNSTLYLGR